MTLDEVIAGIPAFDDGAAARAQARWNSVAKPIGSLGVLEDDIVRIAGICGTEDVRLGRRVVIAMCADNGVVAEGVTQTGQEITTLIAGNMAAYTSSVCRMARVVSCDVRPVDVGMVTPADGVLDRRVAAGTANMTKGPAMSREQAVQAVLAGVEAARRAAADGYDIIVTGEMGIGNTTTSSAITSVLLGQDPEVVTGRGAGLTDEALVRKVDAIRRAIEVNRPDPDDALDVLAKVGGFDIAGMCGVFLGAASARVPAVVDGFVSAVAALLAQRLAPACADFMLASHVSAEPATRLVMDQLGLPTVIEAGLRLGEGTGAVCLLPLLDMALSLYGGLSFDQVGMDAYDEDLV